ncbi:glycosyltransferase [Pseudocnuella soli]|uniref:glycosyltransferase n=1 Tax=Pseudocnuella soli TaxID=2502779 RepID=UPI001404AE61|nr:glycosyltransferase [Pseudocnuella soli]
MGKQVHIVCFDAPAPPDYGGAIDLYNKIVALAHAGIKINLHYFQYKAERDHQSLKQYCHAVHVYSRKSPWQCLASPLPYIVASRISKELIQRLNGDDFPIIFEGVHTCGVIPFLNNKNRKVVVRLHNNEAAYYQRLAQTETSPLKNFYYLVESNRLERYQQQLPKHSSYAAVSEIDRVVFKEKYGLEQASFVPPFIPWQEINIEVGLGKYCLYNGNLSVAENKAVVLWLIEHVFSKTNTPFFVAGKNAPRKLADKIAQHQNIQLVNNPSDEEMERLIKEAQINILPSLNETGIKLKLLHALFCGRHCITNQAGVAGSGLNELVHLAEDADAFLGLVQTQMQQAFTEKEMQQRVQLLHAYNNQRNAAALIALL